MYLETLHLKKIRNKKSNLFFIRYCVYTDKCSLDYLHVKIVFSPCDKRHMERVNIFEKAHISI